MGKRNKGSAFPVARIKKIMQADEEVGKIATSTPFLVGKALECLLEDLLASAAGVARAKHSRTLSPAHLREAVESAEKFDFLREILSKAAPPPDPPQHHKSYTAAASSPATNTPAGHDCPPSSLDWDIAAVKDMAEDIPRPKWLCPAATADAASCSSNKTPRSSALQQLKGTRKPSNKRPRAADCSPLMEEGAACEGLAANMLPPRKQKSRARSSSVSVEGGQARVFDPAAVSSGEGTGMMHLSPLPTPALDAVHPLQTPALPGRTISGLSTRSRPIHMVEDDENYDDDDNEDSPSTCNPTEDRSSFGWQPVHLSSIKRSR